jgi:Uma2 family endonuclease
MAQPALRLRPWTRSEYERLVELGVFEGEPIELIAGQLVVAEPQSAYHASAVGIVQEALRSALPPGWIVRIQMPIAVGGDSEPEPDLVVVAGRHADYRAAHPADPALVIEVAVSSLALDRLQKGSVYARAGLRDYWIVNLVDRVVEVYRDPQPERIAPYGWHYRSVRRLAPPDVIGPLAVLSLHLAVTDLMPALP